LSRKTVWVVLALSAALFIASFTGRAQSIYPVKLEPATTESIVATGSTVVADGITLRYVQEPPVPCNQDTLGTVVILGFGNSRWQTCLCDGQGGTSYNWEDFFDGGYCAWEGPV